MGSTWWAQGGIAVALGTGDSPGDHAADTVAVSGGLAVADAVEALTEGGPRAIERLIEIGAQFDRDDSGELLLGREGGHQRRRVVHADGDATGAEVMRALNAAVAASDTVQVIEGRVVDLARSGDGVVGAVTADGKNRRIYLAPAVIMASGGAGRMFSQTTNPVGVDGGGIAIAGRAGARLADLEFVQFHPTALLVGKDPMPLITEALRGEGATIVDPHGRRFMDRYHPMAELAPRDIVARAIWWQYNRGSGAYLDARSILNFHERFPTATVHATFGRPRPDAASPSCVARRPLLHGRDRRRYQRPDLSGRALGRGRVRIDRGPRGKPTRLELVARGSRVRRKGCGGRRCPSEQRER